MSLARRRLIYSFFALAAIAFTARGEEPPVGMSKRTLWTTSKFRGRPEPPPPLRASRVFPKISFRNPTVVTSAPGTRRLFVAEQRDMIYSIADDSDVDRADVFLDVKDLVERLNAETEDSEKVATSAVYGLTFHPKFAENRYCYVCYVVRYRDSKRGPHPHGTRVSRFTVSKSEPPRCDLDSERSIITWLQGGHNGGCLKFGPDGCLYISTGDGRGPYPPDGLKSGQDVSTLLSAILRIDVEREANGRNYAIPADNPFTSLEGARGEIWAYGLRNPWKMSFDRQRGELWVGDVGWELWELVYRVRKGDNYGWSLVEGRQPVHAEGRRGPTPIVPPTIEIPHTEGASVTGGFVYRGSRFPELRGEYVFGDWETRRIWGVNVDGEALGSRRELVEPTVRIVAFAEDNDGELFLADYDNGTLHELVRNDVAPSETPFPRKLSETGLFDDVAKHHIAPGVLPFSINAEAWADHATAKRFLAVPGEGSIKLRAKPKRVAGSMFRRSMEFSRDTVLMKTLSLELNHGDPASRRRIETQVLHYDGRDWRGYTYEWNDDESDASLVPGGGVLRTFDVRDASAPGGRRKHAWRFPSRMECIRCHNPWAEHTLAFNISQINREHDYPTARANQIRALRHVGLLKDIVEPDDPDNPYDKVEPPQSPEALPRLAEPHEESADVASRARAYLHANCAHCHRFGGGGSAYVLLTAEATLAEMRALGVRPTQGTFGIPDAQIIAPGDPYRSLVYFRMAKLGPGHMPRAGSNLVDRRGLAIVHDWIRQLPVRLEEANKIDRLIELDEPAVLARQRAEAPLARWRLARRIAEGEDRQKPSAEDLREAERRATLSAARRVKDRAAERPRLINELLSTPSRAVLLAGAMREDRLPDSIRRLVVDTARDHANAAVREVFEPFVPDDQRPQRLGDSIRGDELLKLAGNADRGRRLFHEAAHVQCRNCHRIDQRGNQVGPDLTHIGKKNDRAKLLESMLEPSRTVDPKFVTWLVETDSGKVLTGLLVKKDAEEVILKDARNKEHRLAADEIEGMYPQRKSLMPDLLLRDLTAQQVADLLSYLESLR